MTQPIELPPADGHNTRLLGHVHPPGWKAPSPSRRYHLVVVGAGTAGLVSAAGAAGLGARVALVERHLMGGDCLNTGCVPSKALLAAARVAADARVASAFGVRIGGDVQVDFAAVMERMRRLRADIGVNDSASRFDQLGVDVYLGDGRFVAPDALEVGGTKLRFRRAVIATGGRASAPPIDGLEQAGYLTNENLFQLTELPGRLVVIGGGPIGCEMAQAFARFGSQVTLLERSGHVLPREDPDAAAVVQAALVRDGVDLWLDASTERVDAAGGEKVLRVKVGGRSVELRADALLVAVGRAPNVEGLGLETAGVEFDGRVGVHVNDQLRTSNARIFAAGDICSRFKFTHAADFMARTVIQNALFGGRKKASTLTIPWCTYTDPELAHVGLSEASAAEAGVELKTYVQPLSEVDRAILEGETEGFVKVHVQSGSDRIVGATVVARHAGDLILPITLAMTTGKGLGSLAGVIQPYPTQGEAVRRVGDAFQRERLTPLVKRLLRGWLRLTS